MKMKQKAANPKRPDPFSHMSLWGFGSGWLFALLYLMFFWEMTWAGLDGIAGLAQKPLALLTNPIIWVGSCMVGAIPGFILGVLDGLILRKLMRDIPIPFTRSDMRAIRVKVYIWIGLTTFSIALFLLGFVVGFRWLLNIGLLLPPFIAGIVSAYAAHRYLFRLRLWSEASYGLEKAKNVLEDKVKIDEMDFDDGNNGKEEKIQKLS